MSDDELIGVDIISATSLYTLRLKEKLYIKLINTLIFLGRPSFPSINIRLKKK